MTVHYLLKWKDQDGNEREMEDTRLRCGSCGGMCLEPVGHRSYRCKGCGWDDLKENHDSEELGLDYPPPPPPAVFETTRYPTMHRRLRQLTKKDVWLLILFGWLSYGPYYFNHWSVFSMLFDICWIFVVTMLAYGIVAYLYNQAHSELEKLEPAPKRSKLDALRTLDKYWEQAQREDTVEAYKRYADAYDTLLAPEKPRENPLSTKKNVKAIPASTTFAPQPTSNITQVVSDVIEDMRQQIDSMRIQTGKLRQQVYEAEEQIVQRYLNNRAASWGGTLMDQNDPNKVPHIITGSKPLSDEEYERLKFMIAHSEIFDDGLPKARELLLQQGKDFVNGSPNMNEPPSLMLLPAGMRIEEVDGEVGVIIGQDEYGDDVWAPLSAFRRSTELPRSKPQEHEHDS